MSDTALAADPPQIAAWNPADPDPWLALTLDRSLPIAPQAKAALARGQASRSRWLLPFVRPFAWGAILAARLLHAASPRWPHSPRLLHEAIAFGMRHLLTRDANLLILRHFHLGGELLRFIADNAVPGFRPLLEPMRPTRIDDVRADLFLKHDLNIYNFLIQLNAELERRGSGIDKAERLDFSAISDDVPLDLPPAGRFACIDLQTAVECYTPAYALLLSQRDFHRASNSLQLDETIALHIARLTGEERMLGLVNNRHPLIPLSPVGAGYRLMLHGLSTEIVHGFLREMKARQAAAEQG